VNPDMRTTPGARLGAEEDTAITLEFNTGEGLGASLGAIKSPPPGQSNSGPGP